MTDRIVVPTSAAFLREPRTVPVTKRFIHGFIFLVPNAAIASSLPVFTLKCVGYPVPYLTPRHPVIIFGDSITEGYGATNTRLPREFRTALPESAHRVYTSDTSYSGDLARMDHRMVLNYRVGGELPINAWVVGLVTVAQ
jgi:hypothetical protein